MADTRTIHFRAVAFGFALVLAAVFPSVSNALPVTVEFTGHVTQVTDYLSPGFSGTVPVGTLLTGTYTFESTTPDTNLDTGVGNFFSSVNGGTLDAFMSIYHLYSSSPLNIVVTNDADKGDAYEMNASWQLSFLSPSNPPNLPLQFILHLSDQTGQVWSSDALPLSFPPFGDWSEATFLFTAGGEGPGTMIRGQMDSLGTIATPEPSTLFLLGSGLAGLGGIAWRRHRK